MKKLVTILVLLTILIFLIINLSDLQNYFVKNSNISNPGLLLYDKNNVDNKVSAGYIYKNVDKWPDVQKQTVSYGTSGYVEGSANIVTSIVVGFRAFDTMGEITVLFIAIAGVAALFGLSKKEFEISEEIEPNFVLRNASKFLLPLIILFGLYIIIHGHLSPGGGFQGGSVIATGVLMFYLSFVSFKENPLKYTFIETLSGFSYIFIGLLSIIFMGFFLGNFLKTGTIGNIISAGIIPILYFFIGLKVSAELSSTLLYFLDKE